MTTGEEEGRDMVRAGRIGRAQGLKGEVNVTLTTDEPERRFATGAALWDEKGDEYIVASSRTFKDRWIVRFEGVADRTAAEALNGVDLYCPADSDDELEDEDAWYPTDLIGLDVYVGEEMESAHKVGVVSDVLDSPAQFLLEVARDADGEARLVPFVEPIVPEVNVDGHYLRLTPPDGLL